MKGLQMSYNITESILGDSKKKKRPRGTLDLIQPRHVLLPTQQNQPQKLKHRATQYTQNFSVSQYYQEGLGKLHQYVDDGNR